MAASNLDAIATAAHQRRQIADRHESSGRGAFPVGESRRTSGGLGY
jgi:hypothetical protein